MMSCNNMEVWIFGRRRASSHRISVFSPSGVLSYTQSKRGISHPHIHIYPPPLYAVYCGSTGRTRPRVCSRSQRNFSNHYIILVLPAILKGAICSICHVLSVRSTVWHESWFNSCTFFEIICCFCTKYYTSFFEQQTSRFILQQQNTLL